MLGTNVTALAVDGGNQKWVGTSTSGAWLFNSDGTKLIHHFDDQNSPLPSSNVIDLKINQATGEIFIATDNGMVSYQGDATLGTDDNSGVFAYPNPITSDFVGTMGITGLTKNAIVKITDISGKLIYQTKAEGGLAHWNIKDYTGRRAQPGVYLIFSSKDDGSEALVTKIAVID
jgi:hypothetical protein